MPKDTVLDQAFSFAQTFALEAGDILLHYFDRPIAPRHKTDASLVTIADETINQRLIEQAQRRFPTYAVLGEEASRPLPNAPYTWVCDPLDGTTAFVLGLPTNVFALALVDHTGKSVLGVVYDPYLRKLYHARQGSGAYVNNTPLAVSAEASLEQAVIGLSGRTSKVIDAVAFKQQLQASCGRVIAVQSAVYEAMLVSAGKIAGTIIMGDGAHDGAAAACIVQAAGGRVTNLFGEQQAYHQPIKGALFSNGHIHAQLCELAQAARLA